MKIPFFTIGAFVSLFCTNSIQNKISADITSHQSTDNAGTHRPGSDSSKWTNNFLELKRAITTGDREKLKSFIDFPIKNEGNEIWYLADSKLVMEINPKEIKPFTEADYDKYFSSIFALDLRKTLEKINTEQFFKIHKSTSPEIEVVQDSKSKLEASFDNAKHKITLALVTILKGHGGSKFTIYYKFDVLNDQQIKFRGVHVE